MSRFLLAFETSGPLGSVALASEGEIVARRFLLGQASHASGLIPSIRSVLDDAGIPVSDLHGLVVGQGPGSFTGVRVAAATAKGLDFVLGIPVWAPSSLAGAAASGAVHLPPEVVDWARKHIRGAGDPPVESGTPSLPGSGSVVAVLFDARADRLYAGGYRLGSDGWDCAWEPHPTTLGEVLGTGRPPAGSVFAGDGALKHRGALEGGGFRVLGLPWGLPTAEGLLELISANPDLDPIPDVGAWEPTYLRGTGARPLGLR